MAREIHFHKKILNVDPKQALKVVSNFNEYSSFVPGCTGASLLEKSFPIEIGRLEFLILGKEYFIESKNTLTSNSISIEQIKGPFEYFEGTWMIEDLSNNSCNISFQAKFKLPFLLNAITPQSLVDKFSSTIIDAFLKRVS